MVKPSTRPQWLTGQLVTSYTVGAQGEMDVLYESFDGLEKGHTVAFIDSSDAVVAAIAYLPRRSDVTVAGRWPGVLAAQATHRIFDDGVEVYSGATPPPQRGWASMGVSTVGGRSVHVRPGNVRVDNAQLFAAVQGTCTPPGGAPVSCTEHMLDFNVSVPTIVSVEVWAETTDWFNELSFSAQ